MMRINSRCGSVGKGEKKERFCLEQENYFSAPTLEFMERCVQPASVESTLRVLLIYKINEIPFIGVCGKKRVERDFNQRSRVRNGKKGSEKEQILTVWGGKKNECFLTCSISTLDG